MAKRQVIDALASVNLEDDWDWIMDSGFGNHLTRDSSKFSSLKEYNGNDVIVTTDNTVHHIENEGTVIINDKDKDSILLKNVYHVPEIKKTLFSMANVVDTGNYVLFGPQEVKIFRHIKELKADVIHTGKRVNNLFVLSATDSYIKKMSSNDTAYTWGARLGHLRMDKLKAMVKMNLVKRFTWVYFVKHKSEVLNMFQEFKKTVEGELGFKIKRLHTDNGGEFTSDEFFSFCCQHGMKRELTCAEMPQQNEVVFKQDSKIGDREYTKLPISGTPPNGSSSSGIGESIERGAQVLDNRMQNKEIQQHGQIHLIVVVALQSLKNIWKNIPPNWVGDDPCGNSWDGVSCTSNRVVSITLASINLSGRLSSDIQGLSELRTLDLSYNKGMTGPLPTSIGNVKKLSSLILVGCGFSGPIPPSIGLLPQLTYLSLNSNNFIGGIPPSIGNLSNLYWLDLADNKLTGTIPISTGTTPGLDLLVNTKHFHFGKNQLSGEIPSQLFNSNLTLIHLFLENNQLTGSIPFTLGLVQTLEVVRLDRNSLSESVPENLNNLTSVQELFLANNKLTGPLPDLTGMDLLNYVDMSNNSFDGTDIPPWFSSLSSLTSLALKNNRINGTLNVGSSYSSQLQLIDLQNNSIDAFTQRASYDIQIILVGNPICDVGVTVNYCTSPQQTNSSYATPNSSYSTLPENCTPQPCASGQVSSPSCKCAYPYTGILFFRAPSFSNMGNSSTFVSLQRKLMVTFQSNSLPVDSVSLSNPAKDIDNYLSLNLQVFPSGQDYFNRSGVSTIGYFLSYQIFKPPPDYGPFYFIGNDYAHFPGMPAETHKSSSSNLVTIIASSVSAVVFLCLLFAAGYKFNVHLHFCSKGYSNY
ncbi:hypothetical protein BUALT_Bualt15G0100800 [Buddleja alternifolia]|uniref:non-specific serine/threonine protein kinase n=1 Tax=Buddleja alternifolia TaxID=168488 RepID=A0AAV6WKS2_9LAMI|nr:hypothetical protein BUALT_Bualt15G0100800 [Buddleja alternifolia]